MLLQRILGHKLNQHTDNILITTNLHELELVTRERVLHLQLYRFFVLGLPNPADPSSPKSSPKDFKPFA